MMKRMWINQPSCLQPLHKLHGYNVIADMDSDDRSATVYFTEGEIISMIIPKIWLSNGWKYLDKNQIK